MKNQFTFLSLLWFAALFLVGITNLNAQPANDNLCDAIAIDLNGDCTAGFNLSNIDATAEAGEPDLICANVSITPTITNSVWYSFVAPANEVRILTVPDIPGRNTLLFQMQVFTLDGDCGDLGNLNLMSCNVPVNGLVNSPSIITTLTEGETYYVQISGTFYPTSPDLGTYEAEGCFTVTEVVAPVNDDACNAINLELNAPYQEFTSVGSTTQEGEFFVSPPPGDFLGTTNTGWATGANFLDNTVWFTFTTPATDVDKITIDLAESFAIGGNFNAQVAMYTATDCADFNTFTFVAGNDNSFFESEELGSFLTVQPIMELFCLPPNTTYYLVVDGAPSFLFTNPTADQGDFIIRVLQTATEPVGVRTQITPPSCAGETNGSIIAIGTNGAESYTYEWEDGSTSPDRVGSLAAGDYDLTITDICGEVFTETFTLSSSLYGPPMVSDDVVEACEGETIGLTSEVTGGFRADGNRLYTVDFDTNFVLRDLYNPIQGATVTTVLDFIPTEMEFIGDELYLTDANNGFYRFDPASDELTLITDSLPIPRVDAIIFVPSLGQLHVATVNDSLYAINNATGDLFFVLALGVEGSRGITIDNEQRVFIPDVNSNLLLSRVLGSSDPIDTIGPLPSNYITFRGLEIDHNTDELYVAGRRSLAQGTPAWWFYQKLDKTDASVIDTYVDYENLNIQSYAFGPNQDAAYEYLWDPTTGIDLPTSPNPNLTVSEDAVYTLTVTDACQETGVGTYTVTANPDVETMVDLTVVDDTLFNGTVIDVDTIVIEILQTTAGCDSTVTYNFSVISNVADRFLRNLDLSLSPNPTQDVLNVSLNGTTGLIGNQELTVNVVDLHGRRLLQQSFFGDRVQLNVAALPSGTYVLELRSDTGFTTRRFIKN